MNRAKTVLGEMKFEHFTIRQGLSDEINKYMTATHSVEVDLVGVQTAKGFAQQFKEAAIPTALSTNLVRKQDGFRVIAYFGSIDAAADFCGRIRGVNSRLRQLPAAKAVQPTRPTMA